MAVGVRRMLADTTRLRLLWALRDGKAGQRARRGGGQTGNWGSQHPAKLRTARLVQTRRQGKPGVLPDRELSRPPARGGRDLVS